MIGISGRWKRLDKVLSAILHETAHVLLGHVSENEGVIIDDLSVESRDEETEADQLRWRTGYLGAAPRRS